ncbi:MAG TPA: hypothetical protein VGP07_09785 [Polyangia bacterium]|jgi:hypothetical protein
MKSRSAPSAGLRRVIVFSALSVTAASGCATTAYLQPTTVAPKATGVLKMSQESDGMTKVVVSAEHLPHPNEFDPALKTFVVWSVSDNGARVRNLGELAVDETGKGLAYVLSPLPTFQLVLTAESSGDVDKPSKYVVLAGMVGPH